MDPLPLPTDDFFLSCLSLKELNSFARTSKASLERVLAFKRRAFNIENALRKYFTSQEVAHFRYLQSETQMLISGSTALQFFELIEYPDSDLDLYVEHLYKGAVVNWLREIGYICQSTHATDATLSAYVNKRGVATVYNFHKHDPQRKIQLITSYSSPLEIVLNFHSTCVMNVITHEKAYALYAKATLEERRSLIYSTEGTHQEDARNKYVSRGWTMVAAQLTDNDVYNPRSAFKPGVRYVGDEMCLTIELHPKLDLPQSFIGINTWALRFEEPDYRPDMRMREVTHEKLRFSYIITCSPKGYLNDILDALDHTQSLTVMDAEILGLLRNKRLIFG